MNRNANSHNAGPIIGKINAQQVMDTGEIVHQQLKRAKVLAHFGNRPPSLIGIEACGSFTPRRYAKLPGICRAVPGSRLSGTGAHTSL